MKMLIRIVFVIFIANGIDCLGRVCDNYCDNCCDCFKDKDENEKIEEYEEIKDEGNNKAKSLVNDAWYNAKENKPILKIFVKKEDNDSPSEGNGDKILIKLKGKNNPKIAYQNLEGEKYAFFEIKTNTDKTVYLYCSDVESSVHNNVGHGIFEETTHVSISVIACNTEKVTNLENMFHNCENLIELNIKNFNTTNVTNMKSMFSNCSKLTKLDLQNFNTTKVTNMSYMFSKCSSLKELDLKNFKTLNVTDMGSMFYKCSNLKNLNLNNFNTTKVTNMDCMFYKCSSLENLDTSNFDTSKVKNKENMFDNCDNLPENRINEILGKK